MDYLKASLQWNSNEVCCVTHLLYVHYPGHACRVSQLNKTQQISCESVIKPDGQFKYGLGLVCFQIEVAELKYSQQSKGFDFTVTRLEETPLNHVTEFRVQNN